MNAKNSRCMSKLRYISLLCLLLCSLSLAAQTFEDVSRRSFWQESRNVAGLRQDSLSVSFAEIYGLYESGDFRNTWDAAWKWSAGASTASVLHFERMSLTGAFSFDQTEGYDMCGSMFVEPGYFPMDVLEFTPGRKTLQTYAFNGGMAYELGSSWVLGARIDFESSNLAKRKDLRYTDWRLDLSVVPSLTFSPGEWTLGFSPVFRKVSETIGAQQIGTSESSYYAFLDKGLMYGIRQVWTGSGVHLEEAGVNGLPLREYSYGAAFQLGRRGLYADMEFMRTAGVAGEKEYIWFEFPGMEMAASLRYRLSQGGRDHHFALRFDWKRQDMDENVLEKVTVNGITDVLDHGSNRIFSREMWSLTPSYEFVSQKVEVLASMGLERFAGLSSQMYPYVNALSETSVSASLRGLFRVGAFDLKADISVMKGFYDESSVKTGSGEVLTEPYRLQDWYDRQMEYMSALKTGLGASLRYNFDNGIYLDASGKWLHGNGLELLGGKDRFKTVLTLGYNF